jgi:hypothetical protein
MLGYCQDYNPMNLDNTNRSKTEARRRAAMVQSKAIRANTSAPFLAGVWFLTFAVSVVFVNALN